MSKKKTPTTKPEATRPSVIPIMKSRSGKKAKGKADEKAIKPLPDATAADTPPVEGATPPANQEATRAAETPATTEGQTATPATETAPAEDADATKKKGKSKAKAKKEPNPKKTSCLDAAVKVLSDAGTAMSTGEMIEAMAKAKLWSSPNGQTPSATLYSAILREINTKGKDARFKKTERGKFAAK
jgi:HB1, ASXL, restriction endonuclease HTH domain